MAQVYNRDSFGDVWHDILTDLCNRPPGPAPRGFQTKEILNVTFTVKYGLKNILLSPVRDLNYRFMIAEWLWIMAGLRSVDFLKKYNSNMLSFSDDGQTLAGAYGPRLMPQMDYVLSKLKSQDSRQAVATIWTPSPEDSKDIPCTISLQWFVREKRVHCTINMRSSDIWLGLPYDYFNFSQVTNWVAAKMGLPVGSVTMNLGSSHLYSNHFDVADRATSAIFGTLSSPEINISGFPDSESIMQILIDPQERLLIGLSPNSILWYERALAKNKMQALEVLRGIAPKTF